MTTRSFYQMVQLCEQHKVDEQNVNELFGLFKSKAQKEKEAKLAAFNQRQSQEIGRERRGGDTPLDPAMDGLLSNIKTSMTELGRHMKQQYGTNPVADQMLQQIQTAYKPIFSITKWWDAMKTDPTAMRKMGQDARLGQTLGKGFSPDKPYAPKPDAPLQPVKNRTGFSNGSDEVGLDWQPATTVKPVPSNKELKPSGGNLPPRAAARSAARAQAANVNAPNPPVSPRERRRKLAQYGAEINP
jgi:hypothetical protein